MYFSKYRRTKNVLTIHRSISICNINCIKKNVHFFADVKKCIIQKITLPIFVFYKYKHIKCAFEMLGAKNIRKINPCKIVSHMY